MKLPIGNPRNKEFWKSHIEAAERFEGTNVDYCRQHGLNIGSFKVYRTKLGFSKPRKKQKIAGFSQVHVKSVPAEKTSSFPDPKWLAQFLRAWEAQS